MELLEINRMSVHLLLQHEAQKGLHRLCLANAHSILVQFGLEPHLVLRFRWLRKDDGVGMQLVRNSSQQGITSGIDVEQVLRVVTGVDGRS